MPRTTHSRLSCRIPCVVPQGQLLCRGGVAKVSPSITCCAHLSLTTMPTSCSQRRWIRLGDILKPSDHCCTSRDQVFSPLSALVLKSHAQLKQLMLSCKEANGLVPASHLAQIKTTTITLDRTVKCLQLHVFKYLLRISFKV